MRWIWSGRVRIFSISAAKARGPTATPVDADEELRRVLPVITEVRRQTHVPSVD